MSKTPNAFNTPGMFKIDTQTLKRSAAASVGGRVRAANASGQVMPSMGFRDPEKMKVHEKKK